MSEIDVDQLLESLGDMTYAQAKEFAASLGAEIEVKLPQPAEPQEPDGPDISALEAEYQAAKAQLSKRYRGAAFIDQLNSLRREYRTRGLVIDGIGPAPQQQQPARPQLTDDEQDTLRQEYRQAMRKAPPSLKAMTKQKYRRRGLVLEGEK